MILTRTEKAFIFSEECKELRKEYTKRHGKPAPGFNHDEFPSLEEYIKMLKS